MKINKVVTYTEETEVDFNSLTLLSKEEYRTFYCNIQKANRRWWLRSRGYGQHLVSYVDPDRYTGSLSADYNDGCVRPALILTTPMKVKTKFVFYNHNWTVISYKYALCDESFCNMAFRKDWKAEDANNYETSDVKKYLDSEWEKMKNEG